MEMDAIVTLISSVGFPIFACVALYLRMEKQDEKHQEEMDKMTEAINNNTTILTRLYERLGDDR